MPKGAELGVVVNTLREHGQGESLLRRGSQRSKLFVLGAGVSKEFGLPLADALLGDVLEWGEKNREGDRCEHIFAFIKAFYHDAHRRNGNLPSAEELLTFLNSAGDYASIRGNGVGYKWRRGRVDEIREIFLKLTGSFLWSFQGTLTPTSLEVFRKFVRTIGPGHVYATFNYDLLLETALSLEGIAFHYNGPPCTQSVLILKPHGSINWFKNLDIGNKNPESFVRIGENISASKALIASDLPFRNLKSPVLIAPTSEKRFLIYEQQKVWTLFSSVVQRTSLAFIVGYSLPIADHTARIVLNRLGAHQGNAKRINVINPDFSRLRDPIHSLSNHFSDLVSPFHYFVPLTFGEWVRTSAYFGRAKVR